MSSTEMDLSPIEINRNQDITSWLEGDITQLTARDQNRYQRRKLAITEYFSSKAPIEEISSRHQLPPAESLETLAKGCLMLHEDGQPWGFRALVPGAKVMDYSAPVESDAAAARDIPGEEIADQEFEVQTPAEPEEDMPEPDLDEDTDEHEAVMSTKATSLPRTPIPEADESEKVDQEKVKQTAPEASDDSSSNQAHVEEPLAKTSEENQAPTETLEIAETEAGEETEVAQERSPIVEGPVEMSEETEVTQEEGPVAESAAEETKVVQEDFPIVEDSIEGLEEAEVVQETFFAPEDELEEEAGPTAKLENRVGLEDVADEEAGPTAKLEDGVNIEDAGDEEAGPTAKLEDQANKEPEPEEVEVLGQEPEIVGGALVETAQPSTEENIQSPELANEVSAGPAVVKTEEADEADKAVEIDDMDTAEVAKVEIEKRQERMAAADTVIVPAAPLEALEKEDRALLAQTETIETSAIPPEMPVANEKASNAKEIAEQAEQASIARQEQVTLEPIGQDHEIEAIPTQELLVRRRDSRQLTTLEPWKSPTQSLGGESRYQITGSQAALRHSVRRRWEKQERQKKRQRLLKIISAAVIVSILVVLFIPLCVGLIGYNTYTNIKGVANDGVNNLLAIKALLPANKNDLLSALNTSKLAQAQTELGKAQDDFLQLQGMVNRQDIQSLLQQFAPQYSHELGMAKRLVQVALDVSRMGHELIGVAQTGANLLHGGSLLSSNANKPLLTADDINSVEAALVHAQYYIQDISAQMSQVNLAALPFGTPTQKAELAKYLQLIPQAQSTISQVQNLVGPVAWLLGIGQARHFVVQTLDRGELRSSGGFEGQYGILTLQNGRMAPFSLRDITLLDYAENGAEFGATPPPQYSWMNFGNFGVRDANLSADFPTTAQLVMRYFQLEGGGPADGVIQITPVIIAQFLQMTGPVHIAEYHITITAQNVENEIHAFQQDPRLIALQQQVTGTYTHETRKSFTNDLGQVLLGRIKKLSPTQLLDFGKIMLKDLKTGDLQVYFTNPIAEQWLTQNSDSGSMPKFTNGTDGFMVVQSNVSISKASQYVHSTFQDQVQLQQGGALHNLTITLNYQQTGPVYGFNTYADYLRIYAPPNAQLISAAGFNTGQTLCTSSSKSVRPPKPPKGGGGSGGGSGSGTKDTSGSYTDNGITIYGCGSYYHASPDINYRYCSDGNYELGYDGMAAKPWPIQSLGSPSVHHSDLPGYAMWGGMTLTPMNCVSTIVLQWFVPNVIHNTPGQPPYQMIVGHQAGWPNKVQVSIDASALKGVKSLSYNQTVDSDTLIALANRPLPPTQKPPSTPTPAVTPTAPAKKP